MNQTVIGIFNSAAEAQTAAQRLAAAGFKMDHIDVASHRYAESTSSTSNQQASGNTSDGISGFFSHLFGGDDDNANRYSHVARESGSVVTVHCHSEENAHKAAEILDQAGAVDVDEQAAQTGYAATAGTNLNTTGAQATTAQNTGQLSAQVIEENLQVGKRVEQTGGARLRSRIVSRPVEEHIRLREEHVSVRRNPVNRPATEADFRTFKEGEIEITESAERAVVGKEARVIEEVTLGKQVTEHEEVIRDTVRKTEVDVERIQGGTTGTTGTTNNDITRNRS
jgi:uncharacterized protein (TIGR02271 family)